MIELFMSLDSIPMENTLYFQYEEDPTLSVMEALAADMADWWTTNIAPNLSEDLTLTTVKATDLTTQTSPTFTFVPDAAIPGGRAQEAMSNQVCAVISFRSAARGRSSRGRNYVPGLGVADVTNNLYDQNLLNAIVDGYQLLADTVFDDARAWVVVSRQQNNVPLETAQMLPIATALAVNNRVKTQRRRLT